MIAVGRLAKYEEISSQGDRDPGSAYDPLHAAASRHRPVGNNLMCEVEQVWK
jgi:hypothetical protein